MILYMEAIFHKHIHIYLVFLNDFFFFFWVKFLSNAQNFVYIHTSAKFTWSHSGENEDHFGTMGEWTYDTTNYLV